MLLRKSGSNIILKTMSSNLHDFMRIRGNVKLMHKTLNTEDRNNYLPQNGVLTWNTSAFIITGAPTRFLNNNKTPSGKVIIRVAFIASKKTISKLATIRNYAKRKMRSVVNNNIRGLLMNDYDYIFIAKHNIIDLPYNELCSQFIWACNHFKRMIKGERFNRKGK